MSTTLSTVMNSVSNYFLMRDSRRQIIADRGDFTIASGVIRPLSEKYVVGQYIRIVGSVLSDGVYQIEAVGDGYVDVSIQPINYPQWVLPTGTVGLYHVGDRVTHNDIRFVSLVNNNSWEPGTDDRLWKQVEMGEHLLRDETFTGAVCPLAVPGDFLEIVQDIDRFMTIERADKNAGRVISEKWSDYNYILASTGQNGVAISWKEAFASRLNVYKKMREDRVI